MLILMCSFYLNTKFGFISVVLIVLNRINIINRFLWFLFQNHTSRVKCTPLARCRFFTNYICIYSHFYERYMYVYIYIYLNIDSFTNMTLDIILYKPNNVVPNDGPSADIWLVFTFLFRNKRHGIFKTWGHSKICYVIIKIQWKWLTLSSSFSFFFFVYKNKKCVQIGKESILNTKIQFASIADVWLSFGICWFFLVKRESKIQKWRKSKRFRSFIPHRQFTFTFQILFRVFRVLCCK